jgi:hypothetical protein
MVAKRLQAPYINDNTVFEEFVEMWEYRERLVDQEDLGTVDEALMRLDIKNRVMVDYIIQRGDTLGVIATRNNTTIDKICLDNPPMTAESIIRPGDILKLEVIKPYLSVRTIDEIIRTDSIPVQIDERANPLEPPTHTQVVEEGREGEQESTVRITRINGVQSSPEEVISTRITRQPINRVVEVGTSEQQAIRR